MASIAIITVNDRCCMGARQLSSLVKDRHQFHLICYGEYHHVNFEMTAGIGVTADEEILLSLIRSLSPDLIGFSYRSINDHIVKHLATLIRSHFDIPIIKGGIGATSDPDMAFDTADLVCIGEGDSVLPMLLDKMDEKDSLLDAAKEVPNLWYQGDSGIVKNALAPLVSKEELSDMPFIDYTPDNKYSIVKGELIENDGRLDNELGVYPMLTSRGCPYACTYCHNSNVQSLYKGQKYCRQRSVESVITEMEHAVAMFPVTRFCIYDDLFNFSRKWTIAFAEVYKERIGLPFWCYTYPTAIWEDSMKALVDAGLGDTCMGLQSGSMHTLNDVFKRRTPRPKIIRAAKILSDLNIKVQVDLITANPFESDDDRRETLDLLLEMPKNTHVNNHDRAWWYSQSRLAYFPHSNITHMAEEQKINTDFDQDYASFWEMLHDLTLADFIPPSSVMYLSYLYDEYRTSSGNWEVKKAIDWVWENLLGRPMKEIEVLFHDEYGPDELRGMLGWIPSSEELSVNEVQVVMDGTLASIDPDGLEDGEERIVRARETLRELSPQVRMGRMKEQLRIRGALVAKLAANIQNRAKEKLQLWNEVEQRGLWALALQDQVTDRDSLIRDLTEKLRGEPLPV